MHRRIRAVCLTGAAVCLLSVWPVAETASGQAREGREAASTSPRALSHERARVDVARGPA